MTPQRKANQTESKPTDIIPKKTSKFTPSCYGEKMEFKEGSICVYPGHADDGTKAIFVHTKHISSNELRFLLTENASCALHTLLGSAISKLSAKP